MRKIRSIPDVVARQMCTGCGVCAYLDPSLDMIDVLDHGRRPVARSDQASGSEVVVK